MRDEALFEELPSNETPRASTRLWALLCAVLGAVSFLPGPPIMPSADLDVSWGLVLQHAMRHGWQFGPTITFTYGPLG